AQVHWVARGRAKASRGDELMSRPAVAAALCVSAAVALAGSQASRGARPSAGFYSSEQAARGKADFAKACATCHTADAARPAEADLPTKLPIPLAGPRFLRKWRTTGDLFSKVSMSMPLDHTIGLAGLPHDDYIDIVAFILQVNGVPAGKPMPSDT